MKPRCFGAKNAFWIGARRSGAWPGGFLAGLHHGCLPPSLAILKVLARHSSPTIFPITSGQPIQHSHRRCQQHAERLLVWYRDFDNMRWVYVCLASVLQNRIMGFIGSREVEWYQEVLDATYDPWVLNTTSDAISIWSAHQSDLHIPES